MRRQLDHHDGNEHEHRAGTDHHERSNDVDDNPETADDVLDRHVDRRRGAG